MFFVTPVLASSSSMLCDRVTLTYISHSSGFDKILQGKVHFSEAVIAASVKPCIVCSSLVYSLSIHCDDLDLHYILQ